MTVTCRKCGSVFAVKSEDGSQLSCCTGCGRVIEITIKEVRPPKVKGRIVQEGQWVPVKA